MRCSVRLILNLLPVVVIIPPLIPLIITASSVVVIVPPILVRIVLPSMVVATTLILDLGGHKSYEWLLQYCLPVGAADIHQYNDYNQHRSRTLFAGLTVGSAALVVDSTASASVSCSFHIYSELEQ